MLADILTRDRDGDLIAITTRARSFLHHQVRNMVGTLKLVGTGKWLAIDVKKALAAERSLRDYIKSKYADLINRIEDKKDISADDEKALKAAIDDWKKNGSY